ncbi:aspergillopepsin-2 [Apiospora rasikravindrae]|uniref:Aspergillopepsin-2 n=1 Tax=Apiospora rasikravindrae TaxID=990691 RepID=A0ABR1RNY4_9PEZI
MKFPTATALLLCATTFALAAPLTEQRRARAAQRALGSRPLIPADGILDAAAGNGNNTHVQYSSNWAGAVLIGNGYTSVTGTIVVPTPKAGAGTGGRASSASAWVGIDGDTCSTSILQTGIDFTYTNGQVSYDAWYEWFPDYAYNFNGISIKAGDTVTMTVTASSKTGGTAVIQNESTGQTATHTFAAQSAALCETNAEWIVEDFESGGSLVPFANFGTVTFTGASARSGGGTVGVNGATIIDIQQGSKVFTDCGTSGSSSVYCRYIG